MLKREDPQNGPATMGYSGPSLELANRSTYESFLVDCFQNREPGMPIFANATPEVVPATVAMFEEIKECPPIFCNCEDIESKQGEVRNILDRTGGSDSGKHDRRSIVSRLKREVKTEREDSEPFMRCISISALTRNSPESLVEKRAEYYVLLTYVDRIDTVLTTPRFSAFFQSAHQQRQAFTHK